MKCADPAVRGLPRSVPGDDVTPVETVVIYIARVDDLEIRPQRSYARQFDGEGGG